MADSFSNPMLLDTSKLSKAADSSVKGARGQSQDVTQEGPAFSRSLNQALEQQASVKSAGHEKLGNEPEIVGSEKKRNTSMSPEFVVPKINSNLPEKEVLFSAALGGTATELPADEQTMFAAQSSASLTATVTESVEGESSALPTENTLTENMAAAGRMPIDGTGSENKPASTSVNEAVTAISQPAVLEGKSNSVQSGEQSEAVTAISQPAALEGKSNSAQSGEQNEAVAVISQSGALEGKSNSAQSGEQKVLSVAGALKAEAAPPVENSGVSQLPAQQAQVGEIMTQSALVARYRLSSGDSSSSGLQTQGKKAALEAVAPKGKPTGAGLIKGDSVSDSIPSLELAQEVDTDTEETFQSANLLKDLQRQRVALTELASTQQAPTAAGDSLSKTQLQDNFALGLSSGVVTAPVVARTDATPVLTVTAPFDVPLTADEADLALGSNVKWMVKEGVQNAVVTVNPAGMGPISIKVGIEKEHMSVSIMATQHAAREALEFLLPRLREQLSAQGHESVKVDVSDGRSDQSRSGNGQLFSDSRNSADTLAQGEQRRSDRQDANTASSRTNGSSEKMDADMAEDLQHVVTWDLESSKMSSTFDAYV